MMADNWQPGDLALCVAPHRHSQGHPQVRPGGVYEVEAVEHWFEAVLLLKGLPSRHISRCHAACRFRKIKPLTNKEREEALRDLKAPVREPVQ